MTEKTIGKKEQKADPNVSRAAFFLRRMRATNAGRVLQEQDKNNPNLLTFDEQRIYEQNMKILILSECLDKLEKEKKKKEKTSLLEREKEIKHRYPPLSSDEILVTYYSNPNDTWLELAEKIGLKISATKTRIGLALMAECRENPTCPLKPLLPEYEKKGGST